MKVNIYYGGRGIIDDPTLYVINKMQDVLEELNVKVERFNLYELKNSIITLPASLNECDGIILATTVEWYGIGGYLMQFLDACWLYGNKEKISKTYMCPIVMSTTSGEREAKTQLSVAWEILGGLPVSGLCGYVSDTMNFELNKDYASLIEKKAENIYRTISQRTITLPSSNQTITKMVDKSPSITLSPQETEQLSQYASDESYVQQQKEDISELASYFQGMLDAKAVDENTVYISDLEEHFKKDVAINAVYKLQIKERKKSLIIEVKNRELNCYYGNTEEADVYCKLTGEIMNKIISGNITFQRAFMSGEMQVKGDFRILILLDQVFSFLGNEA